MPKEILLPELAESVVEGEIQKWLVAVGDRVLVDQPIVEVMTDKATVELPSPYAGIVHRLLAAEGEVVRVHAPIAILLAEGEPEPSPTASRTIATPARDASLFTPSDDTPVIKNPFFAANRIRVTPAARKIARDKGVDLAAIAGSGPHGRIRVIDVETAATRPSAGPVAFAALGYRTPPGFEHLEERIPIRGVRRVISDQMTASHLHAARTLVVDEADLTGLKELRTRLNQPADRGERRLTYLPFICRAVTIALERFPALNASLDEVRQEIVLKRYYHLGLAVATDSGLMVPVVRDAGSKSLTTLAAEIDDLATRARQGKLAPAELTGSTFTITSIGNVGTLFTFPIIHLPNAAILGVHTIKRRPMVIEEDGKERIAPRDMVYLSLSFDHRLIDGATAADFLRAVIAELEQEGGGELGAGG
jgi:2-oxoisovalerate dehydrogenase E2 component (dihydrolipoyl transacylase)